MLHRLDVLDSTAESAFDDLVKLAARISNCPISLVSLVAEERQWFKSCVGLSVSETPRGQSFCSHAILTPQDSLIVEDATKDARFSDNPLVTGELGIRFYAGIPLLSREDQMPLGTLCVIDQVPRQIDQETLSSLRILANQVETLLHLREMTIDLTEKNQALRQQARELRLRDEELDRFAHVASHDLQEPLRKVVAFCTLLRDEYGDRVEGHGTKYIEFAVDGARRMQTLVRDLLAFSRTKTQYGPPVQTSPIESLQVATQNLATDIGESAAQITFDDMPDMKTDPIQLSQLFQNLIGNALKYRSDAIPKIHVGFDEKDNEWIFYVKDNGVGIAPEHQERVFDAFRRLHGREIPGTGIGLAICRRIAERLGGRIWVESTVGEGSTFFFSILKAITRSEQDDVKLTFDN